MKRILNKKGSALILVLSSLIILMAVSTVVIMLSGANIMMSRNYSDWSEEYYWLDYAAQDRLGDIDQEVLAEAEGVARNYIQNSFFEEETVPGYFDLFSGENSTLQALIHNEWAEIASLLEIEEQEDEEEPVDLDALMLEYRDRMKTFVPQVFQAVYFAYVDRYLQDYIDLVAAGENPYAAYNITVLIEKDYWRLNANSFSTFAGFYGSIDQTSEMPVVVITASEDIGLPAKQVKVSATIKSPSFDAVQQTKRYAVQANPLYANALTVQGRIRFNSGSNAVITGDVVSCNLNRDGLPYSLEEGNGDGIIAYNGADVIINGNVYSGGDLHLGGNDSSITVNRYDPDSDYQQTLKTDYLFNNGYWFDSLVTEGFEAFAEGIVPGDRIPYIFNDSLGGNVYCNNLSIESGAKQHVNLTVNGNVWTQDDIQNDGQTDTHITVNGTYIGMNSDALNGDPNGSSAVINNAYPFGGTISLGEKFVIPGTSFYIFNVPGKDQDPYQTAESISVKAGEYFQVYIIEEDDTLSPPYYLTEDEFYYLYEGSIEDKTAWFREHISGLNSNVSIKSDEYYILGAGVVMLDGSVVLISPIDNSGHIENYSDYSSVSARILPDVFESKTKYFGTNGLNISDLTDEEYGINDKSRYFYYFNGDTSLNLNSEMIRDNKGIIFCDGNLTLTGNEPFYGSVICTGDLTINSNVTIIHDEDVIKEVMGFNRITGEYDTLLGSRIARRFFSPPGYMAAKTLWAEEYTYISTSAGEKEIGVITRYIINSWKEMTREN